VKQKEKLWRHNFGLALCYGLLSAPLQRGLWILCNEMGRPYCGTSGRLSLISTWISERSKRGRGSRLSGRTFNVVTPSCGSGDVCTYCSCRVPFGSVPSLSMDRFVSCFIGVFFSSVKSFVESPPESPCRMRCKRFLSDHLQ
jgi:hypothetical protein